MSVTAEVLRELGAEHRTFHTVRGALLWYRDQLAQRLRVNRDPADMGTPTNQRERDQKAATFAAVAYATRGVQDIAWLVCWYETRYGDGVWLADRYGCSRWAFMRRMRKVEREVRGRLEDAGVLEEGT